jgi:hypothetical protein
MGGMQAAKIFASLSTNVRDYFEAWCAALWADEGQEKEASQGGDGQLAIQDGIRSEGAGAGAGAGAAAAAGAGAGAGAGAEGINMQGADEKHASNAYSKAETHEGGCQESGRGRGAGTAEVAGGLEGMERRLQKVLEDVGGMEGRLEMRLGEIAALLVRRVCDTHTHTRARTDTHARTHRGYVCVYR